MKLEPPIPIFRIFDDELAIPVVLVQTLVGYKHDEASPAYEAHGFDSLESTRKSWLQSLFSK
jgi:hypothetical protein